MRFECSLCGRLSPSSRSPPKRSAQCASCGTAAATYSAGYAAPVAYQAAYAPTYTTAYAPLTPRLTLPTYTTAYAPAYTTYSSGWYPGYWLGRVNRSIWGASDHDVLRSGLHRELCDNRVLRSDLRDCELRPGVQQLRHLQLLLGQLRSRVQHLCSGLQQLQLVWRELRAGVQQLFGVRRLCGERLCVPELCRHRHREPGRLPGTGVAAPATTTYVNARHDHYVADLGTRSRHWPRSDNPPAERTPHEGGQAGAGRAADLQPEPKADSTDGSATNLQAPQLFDPNDHTAQRHMAPVWTAVYHKTAVPSRPRQPVSWQQAEHDADGWSSASE